MSIDNLLHSTLKNPYQIKLYNNSIKKLKAESTLNKDIGINDIFNLMHRSLDKCDELRSKLIEFYDMVEDSKIVDSIELHNFFSSFFGDEFFDVKSKKDLEYFSLSVVNEKIQYTLNKEEKFIRLLLKLLIHFISNDLVEFKLDCNDDFKILLGKLFASLVEKNENHFLDSLIFELCDIFCRDYGFLRFKEIIDKKFIIYIYDIATDREFSLMKSGDAVGFLFKHDSHYRKTLANIWFTEDEILNPLHIFIKIEILKATFDSDVELEYYKIFLGDSHPYIRSRFYHLYSKKYNNIEFEKIVPYILEEKSVAVVLNSSEVVYSFISISLLENKLFCELFERLSNSEDEDIRKYSYEMCKKIFLYSHSNSDIFKNAIYLLKKSLITESSPKALFFALDCLNKKFHCHLDDSISLNITENLNKNLKINHGINFKKYYKNYFYLASSDWPIYVDYSKVSHKVIRGYQFIAKFWRIFYELKNSRPDKRQAYRHTISRKSSFSIRFASRVLAEVSQTMVPGEPLVIPTEGSYRDFLPLVNEFIPSFLDFFYPKKRRIVSSFGLTKITLPNKFVERVYAYYKISTHFYSFSQKRNIALKSGKGQSVFINDLKELGFNVQFIYRYSSLNARSVDLYGPKQFFI